MWLLYLLTWVASIVHLALLFVSIGMSMTFVQFGQ